MHSSAAQPSEIIRGDTRFAEYARLLDYWPGLVRGPALPLIEDSLVLLPHLQDARSVVDVGSGGGMPGLPLKLARPDLEVTLLEADRKKAAFLVHAAAQLGLDVNVVPERAEITGQGALRESFDLAVCRALARPRVLVELCLPLVRVGGRVLAMRTTGETDTSSEAEEGEGEGEAAEGEPENETELISAAAHLGGGAPLVYRAPSPARERGTILVVGKVAPTPERYPRRPGLPNRRPLGR
jgi:16S rRNA (guanine527-N7)-methyltransferase